ncbi:hypothetical protein MN608_01249 [Microdochium nivale]|nr:hypothetical protein MN608_01249 [Microdochium nivale]
MQPQMTISRSSILSPDFNAQLTALEQDTPTEAAHSFQINNVGSAIEARSVLRHTTGQNLSSHSISRIPSCLVLGREKNSTFPPTSLREARRVNVSRANIAINLAKTVTTRHAFTPSTSQDRRGGVRNSSCETHNPLNATSPRQENKYNKTRQAAAANVERCRQLSSK